MALNAITMSAAHAAISQQRVLANSLAIAITKAIRIHRPKAGSRAAILNRNAAQTRRSQHLDRAVVKIEALGAMEGGSYLFPPPSEE